MSKSKLTYTPSDYDDNMVLKPSTGMILTFFVGIRHFALILLPAITNGGLKIQVQQWVRFERFGFSRSPCVTSTPCWRSFYAADTFGLGEMHA
jgi:hypothetical protein